MSAISPQCAIAAKIGVDGVAAPTTNEFGYGGQKRPLEDAGRHRRTSRVPDGMLLGREAVSRYPVCSRNRGVKIQIAPVDSGGMPDRIGHIDGITRRYPRLRRGSSQRLWKRVAPTPAFHHNDGPGMSVQEIMVPASKAGLERAGVKMVMIQEGPQKHRRRQNPSGFLGNFSKFSGVMQRSFYLKIIICRSASQRVGDELIRDQGFREQRGEYGSRLGGDNLDVPVPRFAVGIVIGRNGEMIKKIQSDTGVRIQFKQDDGSTPERIAQIMGPPDQAQHAADIISDLLRSVQAGGPPQGTGNWNMGPPGGLQEFTFTVPTMKTGLIIGKGGETIKGISQQSGARIELQRNPPPNADPNIKMFTVRGSPQQIDYARQLVEEKIGSLQWEDHMVHLVLTEVPVLTDPQDHPAPPVLPWGPTTLDPTTRALLDHSDGPPAPYQPQGWGNGFPHWQQGQPDPNKAAADANAAAWAAYYSQYGQQPQAPMTPTSGAPGTTQSNGQGGPQAPGQSGQADYTKAWEEYYKKTATGDTQTGQKGSLNSYWGYSDGPEKAVLTATGDAQMGHFLLQSCRVKLHLRPQQRLQPPSPASQTTALPGQNTTASRPPTMAPPAPQAMGGAPQAPQDSKVGQQQGGAAVKQVQHVLSQALHRGVAHRVQVKHVLEEGEHLVLRKC
ncbi:Far upstream element-binding protein 1 [Merluccius polli]|uniref:Far upstream element-binding protein 1 n=1 Tax=Merluccius polli TaxID=89951 RepID=A0AA47MK38_MERPO|nr:Far upstream element-binding protein 1 [Merluccius polli]